MGIIKINQFLATYAPNAFVDKSIELFKDQKIAIDAGIFMHKHMSKALRIIVERTDFTIQTLNRQHVVEVWLDLCLKSLTFWLKYQITPVIVMDGESREEKDTALLKRYYYRLKIQTRIDELTKLVQECSGSQKFLLIEELKRKICSLSSPLEEEKKLFQSVIESMGICCLNAIGEAEALCTMLMRDGLVNGVFTIDTDVFAYGCPLVIHGFSKKIATTSLGYKVPILRCIDMQKALEDLGLTLEQFVDLCILCQCDYNEGIGKLVYVKKNIPQTAYQLIQTFKCIEKLPEYYDRLLLNYEVCREEFKYKPSESLCVEQKDLAMKCPNPKLSIYTKNYIEQFTTYYKSMH